MSERSDCPEADFGLHHAYHRRPRHEPTLKQRAAHVQNSRVGRNPAPVTLPPLPDWRNHRKDNQ